MSFSEDIKKILNDFDNSNSDKIIESLNEIKNHFKSELTRNYLQGKIQSIINAENESEKKKLCKNLLPYFDWYLQGL